MPTFSRFLALPLMAGAAVFSAWGQQLSGGAHEGMSMYAEPSYDGIGHAALNPKTNNWEVQKGWLMFDSREQVRFVSKKGDQLKIPYKSIKSMEYSFYSPIPSTKKVSHSPFNAKLGGNRYLIVKYDVGSGLESAIMVLDPDVYQQVMGSFQSKTGVIVAHPGGYEKHW